MLNGDWVRAEAAAWGEIRHSDESASRDNQACPGGEVIRLGRVIGARLRFERFSADSAIDRLGYSCAGAST